MKDYMTEQYQDQDQGISIKNCHSVISSKYFKVTVELGSNYVLAYTSYT